MQKSNLSITFWQNVSKRKHGKAPLYVRLTINGKRLEISLCRSIPIKLWSKSRRRMIRVTDESLLVNSYLEQAHLRLLEC